MPFGSRDEATVEGLLDGNSFSSWDVEFAVTSLSNGSICGILDPGSESGLGDSGEDSAGLDVVSRPIADPVISSTGYLDMYDLSSWYLDSGEGNLPVCCFSTGFQGRFLTGVCGASGSSI